ncbi:tail fiber domain-containing protein [Rubrivirga sp. IMCC45206]|uniref:tail fiber domain-containing protein n=1 Tax=Rubrivirga sp. IMCC45206 TaxID=3391614 RepID=UPI00398FCFAD
MPALFRPVLALLTLLLVAPAALADAPTPVPVDVADGAIVWSPDAAFTSATLAVRGPNGLEYRRAFTPGQAIAFAPVALDAADGIYIYHLSVMTETVSAEGEAAASGQTQSGGFEVRGGVAVETEMMDFVIADDLIVDGSACIGFDCVNGEVFGFETIRLKENNLRIRAVDTSSTASFPTRDWEIQFNETTNGGQEKFSIFDVDASRTPFTIEGNAPNHSLYVDDGGRIGFGTQTPVVENHIVDGDTPTVRFEQDGSSGFSAHTWDVAGNETNFFIRDVTSGSALPFRIQPGTPTSALRMYNNRIQFESVPVIMFDPMTSRDRLSIGYDDDDDGQATNTIFEVNGDPDGDGIFDKIARFRAETRYDEQAEYRKDVFMRGNYDTNPGGAITQVIRVRNLDTATDLMVLDNNGNLTISGTYSPPSDANVKENVLPVDPEAVLDGVLSMPISTWEYIADSNDALHMGPMAQDFARAFGLGFNDTTIATIDADGVALGAIQGLNARVEADRARIAALEAENEALRARLDRIEALLAQD